jgi:hypothetical protein
VKNIADLGWDNEPERKIYSDLCGNEYCTYESPDTGEVLEECIYTDNTGVCHCSELVLGYENYAFNDRIDGVIFCFAKQETPSSVVFSYMEMDSRLSSILRNLRDRNLIYSDGNDIRSMCYHSNGVDKLLFRVLRDDIDTSPLFVKINFGTQTWEDILTYTKSVLPYVGKIYKYFLK